MMPSSEPTNTLIASYAFDGNSLRVVKVWGADRTFYLYAGTQLISEFEDAASNTYSAGTTPGQAGSDSGSVMLYQHSDHLTTRLTTDSNSGLLSNEQAHYPYGEQWYAGGTADPSVLRKFTSYQMEDEAATGKLNYAVFREHSARIGRFLMADPVDGKVGNPQTLNRYAYASNDPSNRIDPKGLMLENPDPGVRPPLHGSDWSSGFCFWELNIGGLSLSLCGSSGGGGGGDSGGGGSGIPVCFETGRIPVSNSSTFISTRSLGCIWFRTNTWPTGRYTCRCSWECNSQLVAYDYRNRTLWEVIYHCGDGRSSWTETRPESTTTTTTNYRIERTFSIRTTTTEGFIFTRNPLICACPTPSR